MVQVIRNVFGAVETRVATLTDDVAHGDVEFRWPPEFQHGSTTRDRDVCRLNPGTTSEPGRVARSEGSTPSKVAVLEPAAARPVRPP